MWTVIDRFHESTTAPFAGLSAGAIWGIVIGTVALFVFVVAMIAANEKDKANAKANSSEAEQAEQARLDAAREAAELTLKLQTQQDTEGLRTSNTASRLAVAGSESDQRSGSYCEAVLPNVYSTPPPVGSEPSPAQALLMPPGECFSRTTHKFVV